MRRYVLPLALGATVAFAGGIAYGVEQASQVDQRGQSDRLVRQADNSPAAASAAIADTGREHVESRQDHGFEDGDDDRDWGEERIMISRSTAIHRALDGFPGAHVVSAELEDDDNGRLFWEVEVEIGDGVEHEVRVDVANGRVAVDSDEGGTEVRVGQDIHVQQGNNEDDEDDEGHGSDD